MQRYCGPDRDAMMDEDPDGEWVKYEDIQTLVKLDAGLKQIAKDMDEGTQGPLVNICEDCDAEAKVTALLAIINDWLPVAHVPTRSG